jgi:L,D-transpeptidase YcbB
LKEQSGEFGPQHFMYTHLKRGLKSYRDIAHDGGWPAVPEGDALKKGMTDERVAVMRKRLQITGDLAQGEPADPNLFDDELEQAVKSFQFRHNLNQDGVAGKKTIERMNVPVEDRINQIRVNMERARWVMHELHDDFLVVNIAGFNLRRVTNNKVVFYSPVIVGKKYHASPIFKAELQYFVINPTWTVPYSIASREMLPKLQKDPGYLAQHNMIIMDRDGKKLDPNSIDFDQYSKNNFPFVIRQEPGPQNALGEVKFIFPNPFNVYVHDTPARSLFAMEDRAFSHGCIRLQNKWELLMNLTDEPDVWNMDKINEVLASGETTTVNFKKPIDILILYWTAGADREDRIYFDEDVYDRDAAVLKALDKPWDFKTVD